MPEKVIDIIFSISSAKVLSSGKDQRTCIERLTIKSQEVGKKKFPYR